LKQLKDSGVVAERGHLVLADGFGGRLKSRKTRGSMLRSVFAEKNLYFLENQCYIVHFINELFLSKNVKFLGETRKSQNIGPAVD
jgi:hypothetical protein